MNTRILKLAFVALFSVAAFAQTTTVTGIVKDISGAVVTSGNVNFTLRPPQGGAIVGSGFFTPNAVQCVITAAGIKAGNGVDPCAVTMNTAISPPGTYYTVNFCPYAACTAVISWYAYLASQDFSSSVPTPASQPTFQQLHFPGPIGDVVPGPVFATQINSERWIGSPSTVTELGSAVNMTLATCPGGKNCLIHIPAGSFNLTTAMAFTDGTVIECDGPLATTINVNAAAYALTMIGVNKGSIRHCGFNLGASALGIAKVVGHEYHEFTDLLSYGGAVGSKLYNLTGTKAPGNQTNLNFLTQVKARNFSGVFVHTDHAIDTFMTDLSCYGVTANTTARPWEAEAETTGVYIDKFSCGYAGAGSIVENTINNTAVTGNVPSGAGVSVPVADSSVCISGQPAQIHDNTNYSLTNQTTISSIPDGTHVVLASISNSYTGGTTTLVCGFAPNAIFANQFISDTATGGDGLHFDASLKYGAGSTGYSYEFDNSWFAGAGEASSSICSTPGAAGLHISGGQGFSFNGGTWRANCAQALLVDKDYSFNPYLNLTVNGVNMYDNNVAVGSNDGVDVTTTVFGLHIGNSHIGGLPVGQTLYGVRISGVNGQNIDISHNDLSNNTTGGLLDATTRGNYTHWGNINRTQADLKDETANPLGRTFLGDLNSWIDNDGDTWQWQFESGARLKYQRSINQFGIDTPGQVSALYANDGGAGTAGSLTVATSVNAIAGPYRLNGVNGFTGTKTAGTCVLTIAGGIITNVTGC